MNRASSGTSLSMIMRILCVVIAIGHLYLAIVPAISELQRNAFHFAGFALLAAYFYPLTFGREDGDSRFAWLNLIFGLLIATATIYISFAEDAIYERGVKLATLDWIAASICIFGAIELVRRLTGWVIPVLIILSLTYVGWWGSLLEGVFSFSGLSWESLTFRSMYGDDAMFGSIARISSTYVFLFIIFGAFLLRSGAGEFVIDIARAIAGKIVGGPGIVAVIASGLTGTISGSAVANTASTGVITIPLMKKAGFPPKFAGGVEAAASTGGQLMPPIMGAGAFVMASFTLIPYEHIVAVAALPALLYFLSVIFFVRAEARRLNLPSMPAEGRSVRDTLKRSGLSFILPIGLLITMLIKGFTPAFAAVAGIMAVIVSSWFTTNKMGPKAILEALELGTKNMVLTAVLLCAVGLVINVIATTGVGNTFSLMIAHWAGGNILVAVILIAIASLVLGMGLPVTAAYIVLATLSAPALAGMIADRAVIDALVAGSLSPAAQAVIMMGVPEAASQVMAPMPLEHAQALMASLPMDISAPLRDLVVPPAVTMAALLSAHMIIFWLSQDSNVTPPVALAAFTAAAIARSPAMATGVASWKLAKGLYIVPLLFAYTPLLSGDWIAMMTVFAFAVVGIYSLVGALQGCMQRPIGWVTRAFALLAGIGCMWPYDIYVQIASVVVVLVLYWISLIEPKEAGAVA